MTVTKAKWTLDEYHRMIEAGILSDRRVELLKGEIVEMPSEGMPHTKSRIYAEVGIPEYWVANLQKRHLVVFRDPQEGEYGTKLTLTTGVICPIACPDVAVAIAQIIAA
jgi:Uma2 family endonuclease